MHTVVKKNITAGISGALSVAYGVDGNPIVQVPAYGANLVFYTPAYFAGKNGGMKNVPGSNQVQVDMQNILANGPMSVTPGDVVCLTKSADNPYERARDNYWCVPGRSRIDEAMAISFVAYQPIDGQLGSFRIGSRHSPLIPILRSSPLLPGQLHIGKLPSVVDLSTFSDVPTFEYMEKIFSDFCGEFYSGWSTDTGTPDLQHPGYGRSMASLVSQGLLLLCSTEPVHKKAKLANLMTQWGIDLAGAFADGRQNFAGGGHMQGRKALIVLAGFLLNIPQIQDPNSVIGKVFQEDDSYFTDPNGAWWFGWKHGWRFQPGLGDYLKRTPDTWTSDERGQKFQINGYLWHSCGSNVGTALASILMRTTKEMGESYIGMIRQWMTGPGPEVNALLVQNGVNLPWGSDYHNGPGNGFCAEAWRRYNQM